jgi:rod shape determining protein RodA
MSYLEYTVKSTPTGLRKILFLNWPLTLLLSSVACVGFLMLYSVAGGSFTPWAEPQMKRFAVGLVLMIAIGMTPIWFWRSIAGFCYGVTVILLIAVDLFGEEGKGAQRWIDLGFMRLQPSELMKITLVMFLAAYYDWLPPEKKSRPLWVLLPIAIILLPTALVIQQPDLGTSLLLVMAGGGIMFLAGVHYQYRRIDTFIDPSADPLGAGYHITQSKIALGSGGWTGRGFMQGPQSRLNFLPEKHTDFIFTTLAEEFGFVGGISLLVIYLLVIFFCIASALANRDRFSSLLILGIALNFFLFFAVNMAMVMGLIPVVGVPLPLVSYGGSAMLVLMLAFGLVQSAHVHRPR